MTVVIGISAYYHNAACCLLRDGRLVAAAEEERFSRIKHDAAFPKRSFKYCLESNNLSLTDIDCVAFYEQPELKLERQIWTLLNSPDSPILKQHLSDRLSQINQFEYDLRAFGYAGKIEYVDHHLSHAASSYFYSGFDEASILTVDGVGEWTTTGYLTAQHEQIEFVDTVEFPDSLGLLYSAITAYLGFRVNSGEYKVMGLAPYGNPVYCSQIEKLLTEPYASDRSDFSKTGYYRLDLQYFDFMAGHTMYSHRMSELLGQPPRVPESPIEQFHKDVACSLQRVLEQVLLDKAAYLYSIAPHENLCMAGGVALNCVANAKIRRQGPFRRMFVQPASNDAGGALGAAAMAVCRLTGTRPQQKAITHMNYGPETGNSDIKKLLHGTSIDYLDYSDDESGLMDAVAQRLSQGQVIGWVSGRMEFGPRALGSRSILADPRDPEMRDRINSMVKKRESFRPFAPAIMIEHVAEHFDLDKASPFMLETTQTCSEIKLPGVTHVDGSARLQTVDSVDSPRFHALLSAFYQQTGCPVLLNTSFNERGEPIVCSVMDALQCFVRAQLDCLVLENFLIDRHALPNNWSFLVAKKPVERAQYNNNVYTMI